MNEFVADLAYSNDDELFWDSVYRKAFPNLVCHKMADGDHPTQRQGIDRILLLSNGRTLYVDEKKRRRDREDILLEYCSNDRTGAPGWIEKDLAIDYMAYAFMPSRRVYLYPWQMLRRVWIAFGEQWKKECDIIPAPNNGYTTYSVAVNIPILNSAVRRAMVIEV